MNSIKFLIKRGHNKIKRLVKVFLKYLNQVKTPDFQFNTLQL